MLFKIYLLINFVNTNYKKKYCLPINNKKIKFDNSL